VLTLLTPSRLPAQGPPICTRAARAWLRTSATATTADAQEAQSPAQAPTKLSVAVSYLYDVMDLCVVRIDGTLSGTSPAVKPLCGGPQTSASYVRQHTHERFDAVHRHHISIILGHTSWGLCFVLTSTA